jgi:hypothetical protein
MKNSSLNAEYKQIASKYSMLARCTYTHTDGQAEGQHFKNKLFLFRDTKNM